MVNGNTINALMTEWTHGRCPFLVPSDVGTSFVQLHNHVDNLTLNASAREETISGCSTEPEGIPAPAMGVCVRECVGSYSSQNSPEG